MNKNVYYITLNIIIVVLTLILFINIFLNFICPMIYKKSDFISSEIKDYKDYFLIEESISYYLFTSSQDSNLLKNYLHSNNTEKNKKYSEKLDNTLKLIYIIKVKKGLNNIYIAYYKINNTSEESKIVLQVDNKKNTYKILYDSIYESVE